MKQELIQKKLRKKFLKQGVKMISPETVFSNQNRIGKISITSYLFRLLSILLSKSLNLVKQI